MTSHVFARDNTNPPFRPMRGIFVFAAILLFFCISGACGLLYQVVWTRKLVLLFGTTAYAVSTVLSIFFLGLGLGSFWGGRLADRTQRPLFLYGVFEIVIGLWALLFIVGIGAGESAVVAVLRLVSSARETGLVVRGLLAVVTLIVPVTLMGATLPLLSKFVTTERVRGLRIGALYSINTFGAVAGCALTGFLLLATFGYTRTTVIGVAGNVGIGLLAILISRAIEGRGAAILANTPKPTLGAPSIGETRGGTSSRPAALGVAKLVVLAFAVSGFSALALEVLWTRLLATCFIGTTYAFTTMLTTLLCGIGVGSAVASLFVDRSKHPVSLFGMVQLLFGLACLLGLIQFAGFPERFASMQLDAGFDWLKLLRVKFFLSFLVLFPPTFLSGMTFPIAVKAVAKTRENVGESVGKLYAANTLGGVFGALAGGYVVLPSLGTQKGILLLGLVLCVMGALLILACPTRRSAIKLLAVAVGVAWVTVIVMRLPSDVGLVMAKGPVPEGDKVIHYREGVEGTVAVSEPADNPTKSNRVLWINGVQATMAIEKGIRMNRLQGVLPLLFEHEPRTALFMCFGSGITCGMLAQGPFERIDAVEIARDVLEAAPLFEKDNLGVIDNPKVNFVVDDGRNFLLTTPNQYDVITFEPMPLALAGVSTFYTQEYYRLCLQHLTSGGLVSQWVPIHSLSPDLVHSLAYTFTTVFPEYCAWFINSDLFLIGSNQPLSVDYDLAMDRISTPEIQAALAQVGLGDTAELLTCFFMGKANLAEYVQGGSLVTDDRPWAEFVAPKLMYERTEAETLKQLTPLYESPLSIVQIAPDSMRNAGAVRQTLQLRSEARVEDLEGITQIYGGMIGGGQEESFKKALAIDPQDYTARYYIREIAVQRVGLFIRWEEFEKAEAYLAEFLQLAPDLPDLHLLLGDCLAAQGKTDEAIAAYRAYRDLGGAEPRAREYVQSVQSTPAPDASPAS